MFTITTASTSTTGTTPNPNMAAFIPLSPFRGLPVLHRSTATTSSPHQSYHSKQVTRCTINVARIANRSYQLEEDEDSLSCTSAVYLYENGSLSIGRTDGPSPENVRGTWKYKEFNGELLLEIERFFEESNISFSVKRVLRGHLDDSRKNLANLPVFVGAMYQHPADFSANSEIGWFAMIRATDDLPSENFDISK